MTFINGQQPKKSPEAKKLSRIARRAPKRLVEQAKPSACWVIGADGERHLFVRPTSKE